MRWSEKTLGELIEIKHGFAFKSKFFSNDGDFVVLTPGNCRNEGGFKDRGDKEKRYIGGFPDEYLLNKGDLLVVMTDLVNTAPVLGGSFVIPVDNRYLHNQRLGLVIPRNLNNIDKRFLYYLFNTHGYRGQVRGSASGATVRHTSPSRIKACKIRVPQSVKDQHKIGALLSAYDDLIENHRRRIALLEESARLLYNEWFVRFRFPDNEPDRVVDGIPYGWERRRLIDVAEIVMGQSPKSEFYNQNGDGLPFHQGVTNFNFRFVHHKVYCTKPTRLSQAGDILFSVRAPVGRINLTDDIIAIGRGLSAMRSRTGHQSFLFYQLKSFFFKENMVGGGTIYAAVTKKQLENQELVCPPLNIMDQFDDFVCLVDQQIKILTLSVEKLSKARDILLPKLMRGEISI